MESLKRNCDRLEKSRYVFSVPGHSCEVVSWSNPNYDNLETRGRIIYVPGIPGDTLDDFGKVASQWILGDKKWTIVGVLHSGLVENGIAVRKEEVNPDDWVWDVKIAIEHDFKKGIPLTIVGHSFGGLLALTALADLVNEGKIDRYSSQIRLIAVSSPFYSIESLPDRRPLLGTDSGAKFSFYTEPMASIFAYEHIWDYLRGSNLIDVLPDKTLFNTEFMQMIDGVKEKAAILKDTDIIVMALFPWQDRWVSQRAGKDLQEMLGRPILVESFDIPSSEHSSMVGVNAHDLVKEWAPVVYKCL